ncbi:MAG: methylglyoxal synthase [Rikenellaceae bacterium]|nr:methylglyoxal synthase [Rikenellaceae bacterium]
MKNRKRIALVAHDSMKADLAEWVDWNWEILVKHHIICTGTTGKMVEKTILAHHGHDADNFDITLLKSGPLGGDQQLGAKISQNEIDLLIFFWDPMTAQPHDVDVKALMRLASVYNIPMAINRSTADFLISSPFFEGDYNRTTRDYTAYIERPLHKK